MGFFCRKNFHQIRSLSTTYFLSLCAVFFLTPSFLYSHGSCSCSGSVDSGSLQYQPSKSSQISSWMSTHQEDISVDKGELELFVYKSPGCECCDSWVAYMAKHGYRMKVFSISEDEMRNLKVEHKIPEQMWSCHTAVLGNYFFEGHIPSEDILRFIQNPPVGALGLAVPGMPIGSPGMESGSFRESYYVYVIGDDFGYKVWGSH